jgi:hypothetical protein
LLGCGPWFQREEVRRTIPSQAERERGLPERRRAGLVLRLLAGGTVDSAELSYELAGWHLGVVGTGVGVGRALRGLAAEFDCQLLAVSCEETSVWVWIGGERAAVVRGVRRLASTRWPAGVSLAFGELAEGPEGWCLTHNQAQDASLVSRHRRQTLTRYADVALLAPWLRDEARARWLVGTYLSPLDACRCSPPTLRVTLREYFAASRNASAAVASQEPGGLKLRA